MIKKDSTFYRPVARPCLPDSGRYRFQPEAGGSSVP